jgi:hypothetical protein
MGDPKVLSPEARLMDKFRLLVTDITEFGKLRCVAGYPGP